MSYQQLTYEQRYQIYACRQVGYSQTQIGREIGCHKSTVSRELRRNQGQKGYRPRQADDLALRRRRQSRGPRIQLTTWEQVERFLREQWSPEQVRSRLKLEKQASVSHERIYQYIDADKQQGGTLHLELRCRKKQRKRYGGRVRQAQIPNRTSIEERPKIVETKRRLGDWEADTIVGARHQGGILSAVERKSRYTQLAKLETKGALEMKRVLVALLLPLIGQLLTMTVDNGKEFSEHKAIAALLGVAIYFAHPYCSWERGLNENTNGLIRQYFPKKTDFSKVTQADVEAVATKLNHRPRKSLGYRTPLEVFTKQRMRLCS